MKQLIIFSFILIACTGKIPKLPDTTWTVTAKKHNESRLTMVYDATLKADKPIYLPSEYLIIIEDGKRKLKKKLSIDKAMFDTLQVNDTLDNKQKNYFENK